MRKGIISVLLSSLALLLGLICLLLYNTVNYSARQIPVTPITPLALSPAAVTRLSQAVQVPTLSLLSDTTTRRENFQNFHAFLKQSFPRVHEALTLTHINEHGLLFEWTGSDGALKPVLLLSHQDVVPVESGTESDWIYPPFSGIIADGYVWGRGAWDDKSTLMASLEALEMLLAEGVRPTRTLMLAFGHDEEIGGQQGAAAIAKHLQQKGLQFDFILDEGAVIGLDFVPGVEQPVAMIGSAEKGYLTLRLSTHDQGGHSSVPPPISAIGRLAKALARLQDEPLPARMTQPVRDMLDTLGPNMPWSKRLVLSNLWLFEPLLVSQMAANRATQAYVRTTTAPTMLAAGVKENIMPQTATAMVNFRILPGQTRLEVIQQVQRIIADNAVSVVEAGSISSEPSATSNRGTSAFSALALAIRQVNPDVLVTPSLLFGATDSRHYATLSDNLFRFTPIRISGEDFKRLHGTNERIAVADYENSIRFYYQLITNTVINPAPPTDG